MSTDKIRNIAIVGHSGTGKTSLADGLIYTAGLVNRLGSVNDGTSVSDYLDEERERKQSIRSSLLNFEHGDVKINVIDTPGYADFIGNTYEALAVADAAIVMVNAFNGVEIGTLKIWRLLEERNVPRIVFVNHLDNENAKWEDTLADIKEKLGNNVVPIQLPTGSGGAFKGFVSLREKKAYTRKDGDKEAYDVADVPADLADQVEAASSSLTELASEGDDALLEKYLETMELTKEEINHGLVAGVAAGKIFPVMVGSATKTLGLDALKDAVVNLLPAPDFRKEAKGVKKQGSEEEVTREISTGAPFSGFVFKMVSEDHLGDIYYFKVLSGEAKAGMDVLNTTRDGKERLGQLFAMQGKERKEVSSLVAGDIGATVKLKNTHICDTFSASQATIVYPAIKFPQAIIDMAIVGTVKGAEEKIGAGLTKIAEEDPTFTFGADPELHQIIINGMGEVQVELHCKKLKTKYNVEAELVKPNIPYRETVKKNVEGHKKYKKQSGGRGQYGEVYIRLAPQQSGEGFEFVNAIVGGAIPGKFIPSVEKGIVEAMVRGPVAGYKVVDVKVELYDGSFHDVDSSEAAFKLAGGMAFKDSFLTAGPVLLEPIYNIEVMVPEDHMGDVMGDLSGRRGKIAGMDSENGMQVIKATVPLPELYKYSTVLRSLTQGAGEYSRTFSHYEQVPRELQDKVVADTKKRQEEEAK